MKTKVKRIRLQLANSILKQLKTEDNVVIQNENKPEMQVELIPKIARVDKASCDMLKILLNKSLNIEVAQKNITKEQVEKMKEEANIFFDIQQNFGELEQLWENVNNNTLQECLTLMEQQIIILKTQLNRYESKFNELLLDSKNKQEIKTALLQWALKNGIQPNKTDAYITKIKHEQLEAEFKNIEQLNKKIKQKSDQTKLLIEKGKIITAETPVKFLEFISRNLDKDNVILDMNLVYDEREENLESISKFLDHQKQTLDVFKQKYKQLESQHLALRLEYRQTDKKIKDFLSTKDMSTNEPAAFIGDFKI